MNRVPSQQRTAGAPGGPGDCPVHSPNDGPQLPRKERETRRHRRELLEAAEGLLAAKRFHEITVQDIAAESEFSVGYIYRLFPHKDDILAALIHQKLGELRLLLDQKLDAGAAWDEQALGLLLAMFTWLEETPAYRSGVIPDLKVFARVHSGVASDLAGFREFFRDRVDDVFRDALRIGHLEEDEAGMVARTFRALVSGFTDEGLLENPQEEGLGAHAPLIVHIIRRAFAPRGGDR